MAGFIGRGDPFPVGKLDVYEKSLRFENDAGQEKIAPHCFYCSVRIVETSKMASLNASFSLNFRKNIIRAFFNSFGRKFIGTGSTILSSEIFNKRNFYPIFQASTSQDLLAFFKEAPVAFWEENASGEKVLNKIFVLDLIADPLLKSSFGLDDSSLNFLVCFSKEIPSKKSFVMADIGFLPNFVERKITLYRRRYGWDVGILPINAIQYNRGMILSFVVYNAYYYSHLLKVDPLKNETISPPATPEPQSPMKPEVSFKDRIFIEPFSLSQIRKGLSL